ncbi:MULTISPECIES: DEAD/DEAH box helicase [Veillonella]|uniref:DEAD/DEAH box helicase n=1 Tax=Veillonella TaxID=29465 RepID=UPI001D050053|nr:MULTISPECIES: DEAD/DEAH box helicase [Veillonella]DAW59767.1 MAG TPA: Helicase of the snf2 rad54 family [Caudoviricetes sp.]MCB5743552.1 DEAD/DEAH box helicase [Veillonella ratti]MCB5757528.1 DEAD/DEAH box helicase [Veillonella ratti]MCB5759830.1 DEAD/DEAH box helicase [Veillonella ratti]MCB5762126.1 DEAD/DEAH box helicase [Veillonella ratti]
MQFTPHSYQRAAIDALLTHTHYGLMLDMGLGKTVITLTAIKALLDDWAVAKVLIIAPKKVADSTWATESQKWDHTKDLRVVKVMGSEDKRRQALAADADIYIINREMVVWLCEQYKQLPFDMLIIDESSNFKNPQAKRFKALKKQRGVFSRIVLLTGTPAPNTLEDLWAQVYLLDAGERLGRTITAYRSKYFTPAMTNGHVVYSYKLRKGADTAIHSKIRDICLSMKKQDVMDEITMQDGYISRVVKVSLTPDEEATYNDMERDFVLALPQDEVISAASAAALSNKLLQLANGSVYTDEGDVVTIHTRKVDALKEIASREGNLLVFYNFKHDREAIRAAFPDAVDLSDDETLQAWDAGKIKMLLAHPASAGYGLNLQQGGHVIVWYGMTWSLEQYLQANARLNRQGQTHLVTIYHLLTTGTIDSQVMRALERKEKGQNALLEAIKLRRDSYR